MKIRLFVAFLFISNCYLVNAQMPDWVALSETFIAAFDEDNPETSKQIYLYQRCAANRLAIGWVLQEADQELAEIMIKMLLSSLKSLPSQELCLHKNEELSRQMLRK